MYPAGPWKIIAEHVGTRTTDQAVTHGKAYRVRQLEHEHSRRQSMINDDGNDVSVSTLDNDDNDDLSDFDWSKLADLVPLVPEESEYDWPMFDDATDGFHSSEYVTADITDTDVTNDTTLEVDTQPDSLARALNGLVLADDYEQATEVYEQAAPSAAQDACHSFASIDLETSALLTKHTAIASTDHSRALVEAPPEPGDAIALDHHGTLSGNAAMESMYAKYILLAHRRLRIMV